MNDMSMVPYNPEQVARIKLQDYAAEAAIEAAGDYAHAGFDEHDQLMQGIRAYLWACKTQRLNAIADVETVRVIPVPLTVEEADLMVKMGQMFLAKELSNRPDEPSKFDDYVKII